MSTLRGLKRVLELVLGPALPDASSVCQNKEKLFRGTRLRGRPICDTVGPSSEFIN
jgi:hypothetical protein